MRMHMDSPVFPRELEREIFETMALMHPGKIPTLLRVARRVLFWIEPLLFRVISVTPENSEIVPALLKAMDCKPPAVFHGVRHIMLPVESDAIFPHEDAKRLLKLCNRLISFACDFYDTSTGPNLLPMLAALHPQRLLLRPRHLFGKAALDLQHPLFHSVTHLDLIGLTGVGDVLEQVTTLTTLTHLSVSHASPRRRLLAVLGKCPHLMLLLVKVISSVQRATHSEEHIPHVYDVRFVEETYPSRWTDWQAGAKGLSDSWAQADDFVACKRKGEIEVTRYWMN